MDQTASKRISTKSKISVLIFVSVLLLLLLQLLIQIRQSRYNAKQTSIVYLEQIINIIKRNEIEEASLFAELKENYIVRAKSISYIIENNPKIEKDSSELAKICQLISVDEVNLFDETGTIYGGSIPNYYGMSFDSGEQMSFFKPMLADKKLSLCQDPTPNTAEEKSMVYAIVWREDGKGMVQVGIEPKHLYQQLQAKELQNVVAAMPTYEGISILVADKYSGVILGATHRFDVGKKLSDIGLYKPKGDLSVVRFFKAFVYNIPSYCTTDVYNDLCVAVVSDIDNWNKGLASSMIIVFVYLSIAVVVIVFILYKLTQRIQTERDSRIALQDKMVGDLKEQLAIIEGISRDYTDVVIVSLSKLTASMMKANGKMLNYTEVKQVEGRPYYNTWKNYISKFVIAEDGDMLLEKVDLKNVIKKLETRQEYTCSYRGHVNGTITNFQVKFMKVSTGDLAQDIIVFAIRNIDALLEEQKEKALLELEANQDKLTGFYNRRAYEDDLVDLEKEPLKHNFVFVSMDVNGLKQTNDTQGHAKGDELLKGAAECINQSLGSYGKVYRTGGDEFVAMIYAENQILGDLKKDLDYTIGKWNENNSLELAVSCGFVARSDYDDVNPSVADLAKHADELMYQDKARFYEHKGIDRRGQRAAYDALKESYEKVLKVNLTTDSFNIIHVNEDERDESKGFDNIFSKWLENFANLSMVHEDDRERFLKKTSLTALRNYFKTTSSEFSITYKRKCENNEYRKVLMEILPALDFTIENQVVYLYVKQIER